MTAPSAAGPGSFDEALRWLTASDRLTSDRVGRALLEVGERRLYEREGCSRWGTYLRAYVPLSVRWTQMEVKRARALRDHPLLEAAWRRGEINKSRLRVILRVVSRRDEDVWVERGRSMSVLRLEELAREERRDAEQPRRSEEGERLRHRTVMAPPGVALMVAGAVEVARKLHGYHVAAGTAVSMMAMELVSALPSSPQGDHGPEAESAAEPPRAGREPGGGPALGDHQDLLRGAVRAGADGTESARGGGPDPAGPAAVPAAGELPDVPGGTAGQAGRLADHENGHAQDGESLGPVRPDPHAAAAAGGGGGGAPDQGDRPVAMETHRRNAAVRRFVRRGAAHVFAPEDRIRQARRARRPHLSAG